MALPLGTGVACEAPADGVWDAVGVGAVVVGADEGSGVELSLAEGSGVGVALLALGVVLALGVGFGVLFAFGSLT